MPQQQIIFRPTLSKGCKNKAKKCCLRMNKLKKTCCIIPQTIKCLKKLKILELVVNFITRATEISNVALEAIETVAEVKIIREFF